jgi:hypothetical protein
MKEGMGMKFIFLGVVSMGLLVAGSVQAMSFDELMNSMLGRQETPAPAPPPSAPATPATPSPATAAVPQPQPQPVPAPVPAAGATPGATQSLFTAGGSCGFVGQVFGCPEGGIKAPPNLPELNYLLRNLTTISSVSPNTKEGRIALIRLGNQLGRVDPGVLQQQMNAFAQASPSERVGALRLLELPLMNFPASKKPVEVMEAFLLDASGKGERMNGNLKASLGLLKQITAKVNDPNAKEELESRMANLEGLVKSQAVGGLAKQIVSPFYQENGTPITSPKSGKQATPKQVAIAVTLMSIEDGLDFGQNDEPVGAMTRRQANSTLDDF